MASVTFTDTVKLGKEMGKFNPLRFNFIIASTEVRVKNPHDNIQFMSGVVPPSEFMKYHMGNFEHGYMEYLQDVMEYPCAVLMKAIVENNFDVVFVCSETEADVEYLEMFLEFLSIRYDIPYNKFKKYIKIGAALDIPKDTFAEIISIANDIISNNHEKQKSRILFARTHKG